MMASINPMGLIKSASKKSPFNTEISDLVEPQEGQGIFVTFFKMQTSTVLPPITLFVKL